KLLAHHDPEQILSPQDVASLSAKFQKLISRAGRGFCV
ncbi:hypothetical protein GGI1_10821, partial [Acidithiobacillus sp. GGI-221]